MNISIPNFNDVYNYFLLQQEDEAYTARIRFEEAILASIHAEEEATHEAEEEISCAPLYEAEEQATQQDEARKAKHRKSRAAERDEYHHHRKPYWKYRDLNDRFALNRKAEKRRLNTHNLLSDYEAEEQVEERWAEKEQKKSDLYMNGEDYVDYVWENTIHENGLNDLWKSVSEDGHFSYSCPEDFGNKFFEVIEDENDYCYDYNDYDDTRDDLSGDDYAYNHGYKAGHHEGYEDGYEKGYTTGGEIGYNRGYTTGLHAGREEGRKYVLDLLKQVGINVDLEALIEQSLK